MKFFFTLFLLTAINICYSQSKNFAWVDEFGNTGLEYGAGCVTDNNGDVYFYGMYQGTVDLDPGPGVLNVTSNGGFDIFIKKLDANRNLIWAHSIGGGGDEFTESMSMDSDGNIYLSGEFTGTADFNPGAGVDSMSSNGNTDLFLLKLRTNGDYDWGISLGSADDEYCYRVNFDRNTDRIYLTGYFSLTVDFDPGVGVNNVTENGSGDIFVLSLDTLGNHNWVKTIGGSNFDIGMALAFDSTDILISGRYEGTVDFDPNVGVFNLTTVTAAGYILKLDSAGNFIWVADLQSTNSAHPRYLVTDVNGNIYNIGYFNGTLDLDPSASTFYVGSNGNFDSYFLKLNRSGELLTGSSFGGNGKDYALNMFYDDLDSLYIVGTFNDTVDFDPGLGINTKSSNGGDDVFILSLDTLGEFNWVETIGGTGMDYAYSFYESTSNEFYVAGNFEDTVDFDIGPLVNNHVASGGSDAFLLKLSNNSPLNVEDKFTAHLNIFPNPTIGQLNINLISNTTSTVSLFSVLGELMVSKQFNKSKFSIDIPGPPGLYLVRIETKEGIITRRVVKN